MRAFILGSSLALAAASVEAQSDLSPEAAAATLERGKAVYAKTCVACHQPNGKGLPGVFPQLDGSDWLEADNTLLSKVILRGLQGPITINGAPFVGPMPMAPLADTLKDEEIADVINYVRASYGKEWKKAVATAEVVKAAREATKDQKQPFTAAELGRK